MTPAAARAETCAREILSTLATRAYRRPVHETELETLLRFYRDGREEGGTFDAGIQFALERILLDASFLVRVERDPVDAAADAAYRLGDLEIASRLSFFLWSSLPDDELLELASAGVLGDAVTLRQQVRRMLDDPRADDPHHQLRVAVAASAQPARGGAGRQRVSGVRR